MFETIREFGVAALSPEEEADARLRLAEWLVEFAEARTAASRGSEPKAVLDELEAEMPNLRSAFAWLAREGVEHVELALRLGSGLWPFWKQRSYLDEGRFQVERALGLCEFSVTPYRAKALLDLANSDGIATSDALALCEQSAALFRELKLPLGYARSLVGCGMNANDLGLYEQSKEALTQALAIYRSEGDARGVALASCHLGLVESNLERYENARNTLEDARKRFNDLGSYFDETLTILQLGVNSRLAGWYELSRHQLLESHSRSSDRQLHSRRWILPSRIWVARATAT